MVRTETSALDLHFIVKELQLLVDGKVDKIYEQKEDKKSLLFRFHVPGKGKKQLKLLVPNFIYLTEFREQFPETPPGYCMFLRKRLDNARLRRIEQVGFERILELEFEAKEQNYIMIVELFSQGNVILADKDYKIISPLENKNWGVRTIRGGIKYEFPPKQADTSELDEKGFKEIFANTEKNLVKTLAVDLGLGGLYAEELCIRAKLDKESKKLDDKHIKQIYNEMKKMFTAVPSAVLYENGELAPFALLHFKDMKMKSFSSFNEALDSELSKNLEEAEIKSQEDVKKEKEDKIQLIITEQEERIKGLEKSIDENHRKGELIYEHYNDVKQILELLKQAREKYSWEEIKEKLKGHKIIKEIKEKEGQIILEL
jgi:predicted ribosome quality control (RQC) complex YloA/Tae2 family protein